MQRTTLRSLLGWFTREEGQDLAEYGLLVFLIATLVVSVVINVGETVATHYESILSLVSSLPLLN